MNLTADIEPFFDDWGDSEPATVGGKQVTVVFNSPTSRNSPDFNAVADPMNEIIVRKSDAEGVRIDDTVTVRDTNFKIVDRVDDGIGLICFKLR